MLNRRSAVLLASTLPYCFWYPAWAFSTQLQLAAGQHGLQPLSAGIQYPIHAGAHHSSRHLLRTSADIHLQEHNVATPPAIALRKLLQDRPKFAPSSDTRHVSGWSVFGVFILCLIALAVLAFLGYKALQWYERTKRPGYVELQSLDVQFHRPWATV